MVRHKKVGDNEEKGKDLKMLEIDEIVALLKLDGLVLHLAYLVYSGKHTAYISDPTHITTICVGTGNTEKEAANDAWTFYVDRRNRSAAQA